MQARRLRPGSLEEFTFTLRVDPTPGAPVAAAIRGVGGPELVGDDPGVDIPPGSALAVDFGYRLTRVNVPRIAIEPPQE